ncbi:MAG: hypothetical protein IJ519_00650 [Clostridia bacterium]|nr:hypothetical protein [Clostridia bacterium]
MNKRLSSIVILTLLSFALSSCSGIGDKAGSLSIIYFVTAFLALVALMGYFFGIKKRDGWMTVLFTAVLVVNCGYAALSVSGSLDMALWANRISYLGSVVLPVSMLMIILRVTGLKYGRWLPAVLLCLGGTVFLIAASPGYFDFYYSSVSLSREDGVSVLVKEYGPLHITYLFYLVFYAVTTASVAVYACVKKKISSPMQVIILNVAVFINIGVWLLEQLVKIEFEMLSVSYVISELFLLGLSLMLEEREGLIQSIKNSVAPPDTPRSEFTEEEIAGFIASLATLTPTERVIYDQYVAGKRAKDVMASQGITENTLKYHNKNIYGKLGVSSRKQLVEMARQAKNDK